MENEDIEKRTLRFAVRIIKMVQSLPYTTANSVIGKQIIRSATSVDSNLIHARAGISTADFCNHLRIAIKEGKETLRWVEMFVAADIISEHKCSSLVQEINEIISILITMNKNAYNKLRKNKRSS